MLELHGLMRDYSNWLPRHRAPAATIAAPGTKMKRKTFAILFMVLFALTATGQRRREDPHLPPWTIPDCRQGDRFCEDQKAARDKAINKQRQADLKKDTDKLYQLATELKNAVDKTNENMLSVDVIRKADEIEKLAKQVSKKMKND
jgi:hypothetical protein